MSHFLVRFSVWVVLGISLTVGAGTITDVVTDRVVAVTAPELELAPGQLLEVVRNGETVAKLEVKTATGICRVLEGEVAEGDTVRLAIDHAVPDTSSPVEPPAAEAPQPAAELPPGLRQAMIAEGTLEVALEAAPQLPKGERDRLGEQLAEAEAMLPRLYPAARLTQLGSLEARVAATLNEAGNGALRARLEVPERAETTILAPVWPPELPAALHPVYGQLALIESSPRLWASPDRWDDEVKPASFGGWSFEEDMLTANQPAAALIRQDFTLSDVEVAGELKVETGQFLYVILRSGIVVKFHGPQMRDRPGGISVRSGLKNLQVVDAASDQPALKRDTWHQVRLRVTGNQLTITVDGETVLETDITRSIMGEATATPLHGHVGFGAYQATGAFREMTALGLSPRDRRRLPRLQVPARYEPAGAAIDVLTLPAESFLALTDAATEDAKTGQHIVSDGVLTIRGASSSQFSAKGLASEHWRASGRLRFLRRGTAWFRANRRLLFGVEAVQTGRTSDKPPFSVSHSARDYRTPEEIFAGEPLVTDHWYEWELEYHHPVGIFKLDGQQIMQSTTPAPEEAGPLQVGISAYIARLEVDQLRVQPLEAGRSGLKLRPEQVADLLERGLSAARQAGAILADTHPVASATLRGERPPVVATSEDFQELAVRYRDQFDWPMYLALLEADYQRFAKDSEPYRSARHRWQLARQKYDIALEMAELGDLGLDNVLRAGEAPGPLAIAADRRHIWISIPAIDHLVEYDPATRKIVHRLPISHEPVGLEARRGYLLSVHRDLHRLSRLNAKTGEVEASVEIPQGTIRDLVSDPLRARTWIAMDENEDDELKFDRCKVYRVDEETLALTDTGAIGMFLALDPLGRYLYTGFSTKLMPKLDPSFLMFIPVRGYGDHLLAYAIGQDGLTLTSDRSAPGVAGAGIVPDPRGRYVAYVAQGGFWFSQDPRDIGPKVALFPAADLRQLGPLLATGTGVQALCFHPHLMLVYAYNGKALLVLDLETGEQTRTIVLPAQIDRQAVTQLVCSPDGRELLVAYRGQPGGVYMHRLSPGIEDDAGRRLPDKLVALPPAELLAAVRAHQAAAPEEGRRWLAEVARDYAFTTIGEAAAGDLLATSSSPLLVKEPAIPELPEPPATDLTPVTGLPDLPDPGVEAVHDRRDPLYPEDGDYQDVLASLVSFQSLAAEYPQAWLWRSLQAAGDYADAPSLRLLVARIHAMAGQPDKARTMAGRVLEADQPNGHYTVRAYSLLAEQAPSAPERLAALQAAVDLAPRNAFLHHRLGDACAAAGLPNRARYHWLLAWRLYPSQHDLRSRLVDLELLPPLPPLAELPTAALYRQVSPSVVLVRQKAGMGTGFFITRDGLLLTNQHVVGPGEDLTVTFTQPGDSQQHTLPATVIGADPQRDMALLSVTLGELEIEPLVIGARQAPVAGENVIAIGNPGMGTAVLTQTITEGIISNLHREVGGQRYLQTSAAVNPGNSGGPLFNQRGAVIGMVTLKAQLDNVGFAIPADILLAFVADATAY